MGLNESEFSVADELLLASSYDFDNQMVVYVVNDMPEPNDPSYLGALQRLLIDAHRAQNGSMLTLFTNRREMEKCFEEVQPALKGDDLRVVCQKWGVSVKGLRDDFLADEHLVPFRSEELLGRVRRAGRHAEGRRDTEIALLEADGSPFLRTGRS